MRSRKADIFEAAYLEANLGAATLPKDEMQRVKQAQRLHKEEKFSPDAVA